MNNFKLTAFLSIFFLICCESYCQEIKSNFFDKELEGAVNSYVEDSVNNFSEQLENDGGLFMWKNYYDYLGFGKVGFKERILKTWDQAYDNETLELYINSELAKKNGESNLKLGKSLAAIDNYIYLLLFPFLALGFEEIIKWIIIFVIIEYIVIPFVAKNTLSKKYKSDTFWKKLATSFISEAERQNRINARVAEIRKYVNTTVAIILFIYAFFIYDFNNSLNQALKTNIKEDILNTISSKIDEQSK